VERTKTIKVKKTDMLRNIAKQSGESVESVLKKKRKAAVGRICRKGRLSAWNKRVKGKWMMRVVSRAMEPVREVPFIGLDESELERLYGFLCGPSSWHKC